MEIDGDAKEPHNSGASPGSKEHLSRRQKNVISVVVPI